MLKRLWSWWQRVLEDHPLWSRVAALAVFLVVTFPVYLAQVWPLFSDKPFAKAMADSGWDFLVIGPYYGWACFGAGLILTAQLVAASVKRRSAGVSDLAVGGGGLTIHSARYGIGGNDYLDVTETLRKQVVSNRVDVAVGNDTLEVANPFKGHRKHLLVRYSLDGSEPIDTTRTEGARLTLPERGDRLPNMPVRAYGYEFFPCRDDLALARPLKAHIKSAEVVWALWNVGTTAWAQDVVKTGRIKKLLLPDPESPAAALLAQAVHRDVSSELAPDIRGLTKQALESGVEVRWYKCTAADTLTIGNPNSQDGWILFEVVIPRSTATDRPSFRITNEAFPKLFAETLQCFQTIWQSGELSAPPKM